MATEGADACVYACLYELQACHRQVALRGSARGGILLFARYSPYIYIYIYIERERGYIYIYIYIQAGASPGQGGRPLRSGGGSIGATQKRPHPQKSDLLNCLYLNCSEEAHCCVYLVSCDILINPIKTYQLELLGVGSSCVSPDYSRHGVRIRKGIYT